MNKCRVCSGSFKYVSKEHVLRTRDITQPEKVIENLPIMECTVCGNIVIPAESQKMIDLVRKQVKRNIQHVSCYPTLVNTPDNHDKKTTDLIDTLNREFTGFFQKLIGTNKGEK